MRDDGEMATCLCTASAARRRGLISSAEARHQIERGLRLIGHAAATRTPRSSDRPDLTGLEAKTAGNEGADNDDDDGDDGPWG